MVVLAIYGIYGCMQFMKWQSESKVPTVGIRSAYEMGVVSNYRFYREAEGILVEGYRKARFAFSWKSVANF